jgi:hypothetical protein
MSSTVLTGCARRGCWRLDLRVPTVVTSDDAFLRALAMRNADLSMSITVNSCESDACNLRLGGMSASGQSPPPSFAFAMEELASTPDAKARNRFAAF